MEKLLENDDAALMPRLNHLPFQLYQMIQKILIFFLTNKQGKIVVIKAKKTRKPCNQQQELQISFINFVRRKIVANHRILILIKQMNLTCQQECRGLTGNSKQQKAAWKHKYLQGKKG